jgi:condensin complex subunit 3
MRDEWLSKCCNDDPIELLKYLDVETYELVGESVMEALLKDGLIKLHGDRSIWQYILSTFGENGGW